MCQRQFQAIDEHRLQLHIQVALVRVASDLVLYSLGEPASNDLALVGDAVDDQAAIGHRHCGDGVQDTFGHSSLEVEAGVLTATEQAPELVGGHRRENLAWQSRSVHFSNISLSF
ncbi:MAG: hypothetical protein KTV16_12330 [Acidimicrobiia bacterium]|nr:hypothetical protein [Acidimicrobiia bacterium]